MKKTTKKTATKKTATKKELLDGAAVASKRRRAAPSLPERAKVVGAPRQEGAGASIYTPPLGVLVALGSLFVHVEELLEVVGGVEELRRCILSGARGRDTRAAEFDLHAMKPILDNEEVHAWRKIMGALLPLKRSAR